MNMEEVKYNFYQEIQIWPKFSAFNYAEWLNNFSDEEKPIASRILDFFVYFPDDFLDQLLGTVVGYAGYYFKRIGVPCNDDDFLKKCLFSSIPGEGGDNITDSGQLFLRKVRGTLDVDPNNILSFTELLKSLSKAEKKNVILVDDFVGSGEQCRVAWNDPISGQKQSLKDIAQLRNHNIVYAPLVVNSPGLEVIRNRCFGLELVYAHVLGPEWNLFSEKCICWDNDADLYRRGTALIIDKSNSLGIKDDGSEISARGFGNQGLALGFSHGIPDACPAFFFWETNKWKPLMKK